MLRLQEPITAALDGGQALVVPDARRAASVRLAYAALQVTRGRSTWPTPAVHSWSQWLDRELVAARAGRRPPRVLGEMEGWLLWRECASSAARALGVTASNALIEALRHAATLLSEWEIPRRGLARTGHLESNWLARTLEQFGARCDALGAAPFAEVAALQAGRRAPATNLAGFLPLTRAQQSLLTRWRTEGAELRLMKASGIRARTAIARAADETDEVSMAAEWARARLLEDPHRRLLVLVPGLAAVREAVTRAFARALEAPHVFGSATFGVEGGRPLAEAPLVRHALTSLRFAVAPLEWDAFASWLRAPYWEAPDECARARLEAWLRERLAVSVSHRQLLEALACAPASLQAAAAALSGRLEAFVNAFGEPRTARPVEWVERFSSALSALGHPGHQPDHDRSRAHFIEALNDLAALRALPELACDAALDWLSLFVGRVHVEEGRGDAAVTITDAVADPLVRYDGIWVSGLRADKWPPAARRDPFIPMELQVAAGVPAATAEGQLRHARALLGAWQHATDELVLSFPAIADDCEQTPSALLQELEVPAAYAPTTRGSIPELLRAGRRTERFVDDAGEPWPGTRSLPRGARSIEHQIRCAFRAYAELRLAAVPLEDPRPGLDPRDRGRLAHRALELVWKELRDSSRLLDTRGAVLEKLIRSATERAAAELLAENPTEARERGLRREQHRAARLVAELCALEARRAPFSVVRTEANRRLELEGAVLNVRIDRIDRLEDGTLALVDYKTGAPQMQDWLGERPSHPQLLVYLSAVEGAVSALATAHLATGRVSFRGIADKEGRLPRVSVAADEWPQRLESWRRLVEQATRDFVNGRAVRDPVQGACVHCHLHAACRIGDVVTSYDDDGR